MREGREGRRRGDKAQSREGRPGRPGSQAAGVGLETIEQGRQNDNHRQIMRALRDDRGCEQIRRARAVEQRRRDIDAQLFGEGARGQRIETVHDAAEPFERRPQQPRRGEQRQDQKGETGERHDAATAGARRDLP